MADHELILFPSDDALASAVADRWLDELATPAPKEPHYCVALSGGRVAKKFLTALAEQTRARSISLDRVHFFWGDERCVPPTDAESNFLLAKTHLLDPLRIQPDKIHRVRGEIPPSQAAAEAKAELGHIAPITAAGQPVLDLIFLGMGEDGHVASLFPTGLGNGFGRGQRKCPSRIAVGKRQAAAGPRASDAGHDHHFQRHQNLSQRFNALSPNGGEVGRRAGEGGWFMVPMPCAKAKGAYP